MTYNMLMHCPVLDLASVVIDETADMRDRINCSEILRARLPELNGGNWLLMGQKRGLSVDETRVLKDAMMFDTTALETFPPMPPFSPSPRAA